MGPMKLSISIWSDIACPWCYVGKKRLDSALEELDNTAGHEFEIVFRSFELDPRKKDPDDPTPYAERLATKYRVATSRAQSMIDNMTQVGVEEGIAFDFESAIPANTFNAHRLLHWARTSDEKGTTKNAQVRLKEALLVAHFEQGVDIGSESSLLSVVDSIGLDVDGAAAVLNGDTHADEVRQDEEEAQIFGITGVPFYVIGRFGVSGAQRPSALVDVIQRALNEQAIAEREERAAAAALDAAEAGMCTPETC